MKARRMTTEGEVEVVQWTGLRSLPTIHAFVGTAVGITVIPVAGQRLLLLVPHGSLRLAEGDWLIREADVLSVCGPSTFEQLYTVLEDAAPLPAEPEAEA